MMRLQLHLVITILLIGLPSCVVVKNQNNPKVTWLSHSPMSTFVPGSARPGISNYSKVSEVGLPLKKKHWMDEDIDENYESQITAHKESIV
ncbi:MAG: hypothetical protein OSB34_10000 [Planktomarina sp.]|nr:hypothetical protein [Planktomarina sp.]